MTIGIIGYGELGKQLKKFIQTDFPHYNFIYFDDIAVSENIKNAREFEKYTDNKYSDCYFIIGLGYFHLEKKKKVFQILQRKKRKIFTYIHPTAIIDPSAIIEEGSVIYPNVVIDQSVKIGVNTLINLSSTISHNSIIKGHTYIAPAVNIAGYVTIGEMCFIGIGCTIINNVCITNKVYIGASSLVLKDILQKGKYYGSPISKK